MTELPAAVAATAFALASSSRTITADSWRALVRSARSTAVPSVHVLRSARVLWDLALRMRGGRWRWFWQPVSDEETVLEVRLAISFELGDHGLEARGPEIEAWSRELLAAVLRPGDSAFLREVLTEMVLGYTAAEGALALAWSPDRRAPSPLDAWTGGYEVSVVEGRLWGRFGEDGRPSQDGAPRQIRISITPGESGPRAIRLDEEPSQQAPIWDDAQVSVPP